MEDRVIEFVRGLRAAGVRVSLAESMDALRAVEVLGIVNKDLFRESLRATLVKEADDFAAFDELFPLYFGSGGPAMQNASEDLSPDEQQMLQAALQAMSGRLQQLLDWLTSGEGPTKEELEELARRAGAEWADNPQQARWVTRRMLQQMGFAHLEDQIQELVQRLQEMGMSQQVIEKLMGVVEANREALAEQVAQQIGLQISQQRANRPEDLHGSDLMYKPFHSLTAVEMDILRKEVQRLVTQLRTRAALRRKRGSKGKFDSKGTIRANQRYGGVPVELKYKKRKLKPSLVILCDVSRSTENVVEFMLHLTHALHDQVSKMKSFAFYDRLVEVPNEVLEHIRHNEPDAAFETLRQMLPYRPYGTDLGSCLETFCQQHLNVVNGRTTLIILGDGRNNYNAPRIDLIKDLQRRVRKLVWFNPEQVREWGTGDSDMLEYAPLCDEVFSVRNLAQLSAAVDKLLAS
ncbi:MAG: VWA domain-containing protein [Ardenticatenaceae bacterium]|nr:VWA domain-containing protein [Anaerolineales bacterium]MCB8922972.1 VWA domain-containing protein [Ardenticatenaceae bacterium]MCB8990295.1 VWA domain-containing protein [Ardenticatenaceae bacterium]